ncbi:uncharacterized protein LOC135122810 isoform X1 [Zophobas morio]|uniref:uncharacterized protein LOC135122810 isoform X1 n=1 Tax=Zophobas morio TaxID=2755281 RepID=UPI0030829E89
MMTKMSDKLEFARDLEQYFSTLGYLLLCLQDDDLKKLVIGTIKTLLDYKPPIGYCCVLLEDCNAAVEASQLPEILAQLADFVNDDIYPLLLNLMYLVCTISKKTCQKMLSQGVLEFLLKRFEPTWRERDEHTKPVNPSVRNTIPTFEDTCCVLWKLLNAIDNTIHVKEPSEFALWSLQYAFRWSNVCPEQKFNRNNLTALILKILLTFPAKDFSTTDIFEDILILSVTAAGCGCLSNLEFSEDEMDFQFKKIIWSCLHFFQPTTPFVVCKRYNMRVFMVWTMHFLQFVEKNEITKAFLKKVFEEHTTDKNHIEQYCELVKIVLKIIPKFVSSVETLLYLNGPIKLISIIEGYLLKTYNIEVLEAYLYCLSQLLFPHDEDIIGVVGEYRTADIVLGRLTIPTTQIINYAPFYLADVCVKILDNTTTLSRMYQKALAHGFCVLYVLCTFDFLRNFNAINLCTRFLRRVIDPPPTDPLIDVRVIICGIHLLWECMITSREFYREFLKAGGVYLLLDVTEACTFPIKSLSLGVLADASKKLSSIPYFITWRKHGKRLRPMLLEIFRNKTEKECDGVNNTEIQKGKFKNVWLSLCQKQRIYFHTGCVRNDELLRICRCRIHGILFSLKVRFKDKVAIANEHYKLFNEKLGLDDEITALFAENFLSLTMCKSWLTVAKELKNEGITPVDTDYERLNEQVEVIKCWKSFLRDLIQTAVEKQKKNEKTSELELYSILKEARLSDALDALKELRYISNCTERMFQMRQKLVQQQDIEPKRTPSLNFHRTICELPFTSIYNQSINIQSNIIYEKKEEQISPTPISLHYSESLSQDSSDHSLDEYSVNCDMD